MRTKKITKFALFILFIYIFSTNSIFALYSPDEVKSAFFNIENINYSPTTVNTESEYQTGNTVNGAKVIKITEINSSTTWSEFYRAIPHINIANYTATIYNEGNSSDCRLLVKTTVDYDNLGEKTTWFEIDDIKTYIYRRVYLEEEADSFKLTFYYLIENPSNVLDSNGDSSQFLSLDTGNSTNYYLFYLENNTIETTFYFGNLSDSLFTQTTPIEFNPEYSSFLQVNATRPASWDPGNFLTI